MTPARKLPDTCPFWAKHVTLGYVDSGELSFAQSIGEKEAALKRGYLPGSVLFVAWPGEWRTDLFVVSREDVLRLLQQRQ
jgi:hypothetical protein